MLGMRYLKYMIVSNIAGKFQFSKISNRDGDKFKEYSKKIESNAEYLKIVDQYKDYNS